MKNSIINFYLFFFVFCSCTQDKKKVSGTVPILPDNVPSNFSDFLPLWIKEIRHLPGSPLFFGFCYHNQSFDRYTKNSSSEL